MCNVTKSYDIPATNLIVLHNYFNNPTKLFLYLYLVKFLDTSVKFTLVKFSDILSVYTHNYMFRSTYIIYSVKVASIHGKNNFIEKFKILARYKSKDNFV